MITFSAQFALPLKNLMLFGKDPEEETATLSQGEIEDLGNEIEHEADVAHEAAFDEQFENPDAGTPVTTFSAIA